MFNQIVITPDFSGLEAHTVTALLDYATANFEDAREWVSEALEHDSECMPKSEAILARLVLRVYDRGGIVTDIDYADLEPTNSHNSRELRQNGPQRTFYIHLEIKDTTGIIKLTARNGYGGGIGVSQGIAALIGHSRGEG